LKKEAIQMATFLATAATAVVVAFLTTLASEPLKMLIYRNRHINERRFLNRVDSLPKYIAALNWARSACDNVNAGWQKSRVGPFYYTGEAAERIGAAINVGIDIAYLFPKGLEADILDFGTTLRQTYNNYIIQINSLPLPASPTPTIRQLFSTVAPLVQARQDEMKQKYRELVGLD
jgi:hypothetical protein